MTFNELRQSLYDYMKSNFRRPTVVRLTRDELISLRHETEALKYFGARTSASDPEAVMGMTVEVCDNVGERFANE